ncbi:hypothetical protein GIV24_25855 [Pseudomonas syringae]|nr:hypothetical protein [Pseudomonas syringae]
MRQLLQDRVFTRSMEELPQAAIFFAGEKNGRSC